MVDPYLVLELPIAASDAEVKSAYLRKVREYPPERDPLQFQAVRAAFEAIRGRHDRLRYRLFQQQAPSVDELVSAALESPAQPDGTPTDQFSLWQRALLSSLRDGNKR